MDAWLWQDQSRTGGLTVLETILMPRLCQSLVSQEDLAADALGLENRTILIGCFLHSGEH